MDTLKERQLTIRASRRPIEYNYTNADVHNADTTEGSGYQFEYPVSWTGDPSTQKVIGIRRINYKPTSLNIAFKFKVFPEPTQPTTAVDIPMFFVFTDQNTFEECINRMVEEANNVLENQTDVRCVVRYDKEMGTCTIKFEDDNLFCKFRAEFLYGSDPTYDPDDENSMNDRSTWYYKGEFLKLFNQPVNKDTIDDLYYKEESGVNEFTFTNVWNRDNFYCHSSFSDSPRRIIGINGDFWPTPSVFYDYSDNSNDFNVFFTTDTVHRILPRNGVMLIQLSYIFNYATSMLQYA